MSVPSQGHVSEIYAAAAEPDALRRIVAILCQALAVDSAGMWLSDKGRILDLTLSDAIAESMPPYLEHFHKLDPWGGGFPSPLNQALLGRDKVSDEILLGSEFYNDFARHYGMRDPLSISMDLGPGFVVSISANRTHGTLLSAQDKPLAEALGHHVGVALRLHHRFMAERQPGRMQKAALDALSFGAVICTAEGAIVYANRAAGELARRHAGIVLGDRSTGVTAYAPSERPRLAALVRGAARGSGGALRLAGADGVGLALIATPLPAEDPRVLTGSVLLSLRRNDAGPSISEPALRQLFGLSPTQAALCIQLAEGKTFEEAAVDRSVAISTARAHFKAILAKTDTRNLRDLLRLLASLPPSLLP